MGYDFDSLSPFDFELLVRDLLSAEYGTRFQSFRRGRDRGIDLLCDADPTDRTITQCKHYLHSGYSALLRDLKQEKPKVDTIQPDRYILATSVDLTLGNKEEISDIFRPYIRSLADVLGSSDVNQLLAKFPEVERRHFKLWLTSTSLLESILHSRSHNLSKIQVENIRRRIPLYVQNDSFGDAIEILERSHACIIAGNPGIGKTTLAEILILKYLDQGFELVKIGSNIEEALEMQATGRDQIFYYDDFLGQTTLEEKLQKNEDQTLLDFLQYVSRDPNKRFILTTRDYILNQAKLKYEKLNRDLAVEKCIIDLTRYTRLQRAHILFNHLYFSAIPSEALDQILKSKSYLSIINHQNYNPRIMEHMTTRYSPRVLVGQKDFLQSFLHHLDHPDRIWADAFHQLSAGAKYLLCTLASFGGRTDAEALKAAFRAITEYLTKARAFRTEPDEFRNAMREIDGDFISVDRSWVREIIVGLRNPSVRDFLNGYLVEQREMLADILASVKYFSQLIGLWNAVYKGIELTTDERGHLASRILEVYQHSSAHGMEERLLFTIRTVTTLGFRGILEIPELVADLVRSYSGKTVSTSALTELLQYLSDPEIHAEIEAADWQDMVERLLDSMSTVEEVEAVVNLFHSNSIFDEHEEALIEAFNTYEDYYFMDECDAEDDPDNLEGLLERIEDIREKLNANDIDTSSVEERIETLREERSLKRADYHSTTNAYRTPITNITETVEDQIDRMFNHLHHNVGE